MMGLSTSYDYNKSIKDHNEILKKIEEIKEFERKFPEFDLSEINTIEELIEVDEKLEEFDETVPEVDEPTKKRKINSFTKIKKKPPTEHKLNPTVFHLRIKNEKLENIDFKKPNVNAGKNKLFRVKKRKKSKDRGQEKEEKSSKLLKIKGGIGRIKRAIPSRQKKSEDETETSE
jgi:hypothetical protein